MADHHPFQEPRFPDIPGLDRVGGLAAVFDLLSSEYGWTDEQILDLTLGQLRQKVAAIGRRQFLADVAARRLETAKLRTLCGYIAATLQLQEGAENTMWEQSRYLSLGTGTEHPDDPLGGGSAAGIATPSGTPAGAATPATLPAAPVARLRTADLPDGPATVRVGQPAPMPPGVRPVPAHKLAALLGGGGGVL